jgi:hypothetical protein
MSNDGPQKKRAAPPGEPPVGELRLASQTMSTKQTPPTWATCQLYFGLDSTLLGQRRTTDEGHRIESRNTAKTPRPLLGSNSRSGRKFWGSWRRRRKEKITFKPALSRTFAPPFPGLSLSLGASGDRRGLLPTLMPVSLVSACLPPASLSNGFCPYHLPSPSPLPHSLCRLSTLEMTLSRRPFLFLPLHGSMLLLPNFQQYQGKAMLATEKAQARSTTFRVLRLVRTVGTSRDNARQPQTRARNNNCLEKEGGTAQQRRRRCAQSARTGGATPMCSNNL